MILLLLLFVSVLSAALDTTTITDTIYLPDGSLANGTVSITLVPPCVAPGNYYISGQTKTVKVNRGAVTVDLVPNDTCVPAGSTYAVKYNIAGYVAGPQTFYWTVPTSTPAITIPAVQGAISGNPSVGVSISQLTGSCSAGQGLIYNGSSFLCGAVGSSAFSGITTGSNTTATMTVGTGASIALAGSGTVNANLYNGNAVVAAVDGGTGQSSFTKGDLFCATGSTSVTKLAVGVNSRVLTADSAAACGVSWQPVTAGGGGTLFSDLTSATNSIAAMVIGSGATLATSGSGTITANAFSGILGSANGGTGNGFTKFSGPASSEKTFTLPNASATVLTSNAAVTVAQGGTGAATLTGLLQGNGTSAVTAIANSSTVGQVLRVTGASTYGWGALAGSGTINFGFIANGACASSTFALTGALAGDTLAQGWPAALETGLFGTMVVTASDVVTVRLCNLSGGSIDPASATFSAKIVR